MSGKTNKKIYHTQFGSKKRQAYRKDTLFFAQNSYLCY